MLVTPDRPLVWNIMVDAVGCPMHLVRTVCSVLLLEMSVVCSVSKSSVNEGSFCTLVLPPLCLYWGDSLQLWRTSRWHPAHSIVEATCPYGM